jgi:hypothetical protein
MECSSDTHAVPVQRREGVSETHLKQELLLAYHDLGGAAFALMHQGSLNDARLASRAERIHELYAQLTVTRR